MNKPNVVFMGTPEFSVATLAAMLDNGVQVVGVITAPDKPAGRGQKISMSAVKKFALEKNLPLLQPTNLKDPHFLQDLEALKPDLQVVVAFRMLPEAVWKLPKLGTFNLHASLLPQYRGAAPINWAIINGENETGITTFFLQQEIDTGAIIFQEKLPIGPDENAGSLHDRLMKAGASLVVRTVDAISNGEVKPIQQAELLSSAGLLQPAPKLHRENTRINWYQSTAVVYNLIRGLSPYPAAHTTLKNGVSIDCKIYRAAPHVTTHPNSPGLIETDQKSYLHVFTADGYLDILELQLSGKQKMGVRDLLNGYKFIPGASFA
jgi:methionyl-tRNA formyltransferase